MGVFKIILVLISVRFALVKANCFCDSTSSVKCSSTIEILDLDQLSCRKLATSIMFDSDSSIKCPINLKLMFPQLARVTSSSCDCFVEIECESPLAPTSAPTATPTTTSTISPISPTASPIIDSSNSDKVLSSLIGLSATMALIIIGLSYWIWYLRRRRFPPRSLLSNSSESSVSEQPNVDHLQLDLSASLRRVNAMARERDQLKQACTNRDARIRELTMELEKYKIEIAQRRATVDSNDSSRSEIDILKVEIDRQKSDLVAKTIEATQSSLTVENLRDQVVERDVEILGLRSKLTAIDSAHNTKSTEIDRLLAELKKQERLTNDKTRIVEELELQATGLESTTGDRDRTMIELRTALENLQQQLRDTESQLTENERRSNEIRTALEDSQQQQRDTESRLVESERRSNELRTVAEERATEVGQKHQEIEQLQSDLKKKNDENSTMMKEMDKMRGKLGAFEKKDALRSSAKKGGDGSKS